MELFEILFIALFILFPIVEQVLKRGRGKPGEADEQGEAPGRPEDGRSERSPGQVDAPSREREPVKAEDMVPDDLWAVLTGEQRQPGGVQTRETGADREAGEAEPWSLEPDPAPEPDLQEFDLSEPDEPDAEPRELARPRSGSRAWTIDDEAEPAPPVSLEYEGPEAYSLETLDHPPQSLERPLPTPEARHRAFHRLIDRPVRRTPRRRSAIGRALQDPESVRNAIVLAEVLGPPKGLE